MISNKNQYNTLASSSPATPDSPAETAKSTETGRSAKSAKPAKSTKSVEPVKSVSTFDANAPWDDDDDDNSYLDSPPPISEPDQAESATQNDDDQGFETKQKPTKQTIKKSKKNKNEDFIEVRKAFIKYFDSQFVCPAGFRLQECIRRLLNDKRLEYYRNGKASGYPFVKIIFSLDKNFNIESSPHTKFTYKDLLFTKMEDITGFELLQRQVALHYGMLIPSEEINEFKDSKTGKLKCLLSLYNVSGGFAHDFVRNNFFSTNFVESYPGAGSFPSNYEKDVFSLAQEFILFCNEGIYFIDEVEISENNRDGNRKAFDAEWARMEKKFIPLRERESYKEEGKEEEGKEEEGKEDFQQRRTSDVLSSVKDSDAFPPLRRNASIEGHQHQENVPVWIAPKNKSKLEKNTSDQSVRAGAKKNTSDQSVQAGAKKNTSDQSVQARAKDQQLVEPLGLGASTPDSPDASGFSQILSISPSAEETQEEKTPPQPVKIDTMSLDLDFRGKKTAFKKFSYDPINREHVVKFIISGHGYGVSKYSVMKYEIPLPQEIGPMDKLVWKGALLSEKKGLAIFFCGDEPHSVKFDL